MRILFIHNVADVYGASRSLLRLSTGLRQGGHTVGVVLPEEGPLRPAIEALGGEVFLLPSLPVVHRNQLRGPRAVMRLAQRYRAAKGQIEALLQTWAPDIVHTNNTGILPLAGACARRRGIPHVLHVRESFTGFGPLWKPYRLWLLRTADAVVCISNFVAGGFTARQRQARVRVLRHGLPREEFDGIGPAQAAAFRRQFNVEGPLVGLVGRIKLRRKGQEVFIEAAARLQARHPTVLFLIIGSPFPGNEAHLAALQALVQARGLERNVRFIGHLEDPRPALAALDVSVMASVEPEPLGNVTIESMALGKPVVGTAVGGTTELLQDGVTGLLVSPGDAGAMAAAIGRLLLDPAERERMGAAAKAHFLRELEFSRFYEGICRLYEDLVETASNKHTGVCRHDS